MRFFMGILIVFVALFWIFPEKSTLFPSSKAFAAGDERLYLLRIVSIDEMGHQMFLKPVESLENDLSDQLIVYRSTDIPPALGPGDVIRMWGTLEKKPSGLRNRDGGETKPENERLNEDASSLNEDASSLNEDASSLNEDASSLNEDASSLNEDASSLNENAPSLNANASPLKPALEIRGKIASSSPGNRLDPTGVRRRLLKNRSPFPPRTKGGGFGRP